MKQNYTHIVLGNLNIDIAIYTDNIPGPDESTFATDLDIRPGGAASNYAAAVSQYGHTAYLIASVSKHELAQNALSYLEQLGVRVDYVKRVDQSPGVVLIIIQPGGERRMIRYLGANIELRGFDVPSELLREAHVLHLASTHPMLVDEAYERARGCPILLTYDPGGFALEAASRLDLFKYINILFVNEKEFSIIKSRLKVNNLFKYGLQVLIIKQGARGAIIIESNGNCYKGFTQPIRKPIDTTGAGDAFNAFFNARYLESKDPGEALRYAVAAGALKTGCRGSILVFDDKLFQLQLERTVVERVSECNI